MKRALNLTYAFFALQSGIPKLLTPASLLSLEIADEINLVVLRIEDFIRETSDHALAQKLIHRTTEQLLDELGQYARRIDVPTILGVLTPSPGVAEDCGPTLKLPMRS